jgi:hypothetical protein
MPFLKKIVFEMPNFKKIILRGKIQRLVEFWEPLALG